MLVTDTVRAHRAAPSLLVRGRDRRHIGREEDVAKLRKVNEDVDCHSSILLLGLLPLHALHVYPLDLATNLLPCHLTVTAGGEERVVFCVDVAEVSLDRQLDLLLLGDSGRPILPLPTSKAWATMIPASPSGMAGWVALILLMIPPCFSPSLRFR